MRLSRIRYNKEGDAITSANYKRVNNYELFYEQVGPSQGLKVRVDTEILPVGSGSIGDSLRYLGTWNSLTNTPTLGNNGVGGINGDWYYVSTASDGVTTIDGYSDWKVNDKIVNNGTTWERIRVDTTDHTHNDKEDKVNKIIAWSSTPDETKYPSEALIKPALDNKSDISHTHAELHTHLNSIVLEAITAAFTSAYEDKLNAIEEEAQKNVQSDWSITDDTDDAYIVNKPANLSDFVNDLDFTDHTHDNLEILNSIDEAFTVTLRTLYDAHLSDSSIHLPTIPSESNLTIVTNGDGTVSWGEYTSNGNILDNYTINTYIDHDDVTFYTCMIDSNDNWLIKRAIDNLDDTIDITYANISNNAAIITYDDAVEAFLILTYDEFNNIF